MLHLAKQRLSAWKSPQGVWSLYKAIALLARKQREKTWCTRIYHGTNGRQRQRRLVRPVTSLSMELILSLFLTLWRYPLLEMDRIPFRCLFVFSFGFCCRASREKERERECPWAFSVGIFFWVLLLPPFAQYSSLLSLKGLSREAARQKKRESSFVKLNGAQRSLVALLSAWSLCDALLKLLAFWYYTCCTTVGSIKGSFPSVY